jgi:hypothetical protein
MTSGPGRACPVDYRYGAHALAAAASIEAETLYVAGGLYGNPFALEALLELAAAEPGTQLVFNGDFNWFNVDAAEFRRINQTVLGHAATRGNVETEIAHAERGAGCGCGYPDWVGDSEVERSNRILERLRIAAAAEPGLTRRLAALPMFALVRVGSTRVGIVHGDTESLAGWAFSQETLSTDAGLAAAAIAFKAARVGVIASSHTCLPVLQPIETAAGEALIANNGAAGMPNFRGTRYGLATRISVRPPARDALYGVSRKDLHVHAIPIRFDAEAWGRSFLDQWPAGSDGWLSYYQRICHGPAYSTGDAIRKIARPAALLDL